MGCFFESGQKYTFTHIFRNNIIHSLLSLLGLVLKELKRFLRYSQGNLAEMSLVIAGYYYYGDGWLMVSLAPCF